MILLQSSFLYLLFAVLPGFLLLMALNPGSSAPSLAEGLVTSVFSHVIVGAIAFYVLVAGGSIENAALLIRIPTAALLGLSVVVWRRLGGFGATNNVDRKKIS